MINLIELNIKKDDHICNYNGEILEKSEADKRSLLVEYFDLNYLFNINNSIDIDAYRVGNQMRYVNHAAYGYDNCIAKGRFENGLWRIKLFALRDIKKGEELFFNYKFNHQRPWLMRYNYLNKK